MSKKFIFTAEFASVEELQAFTSSLGTRTVGASPVLAAPYSVPVPEVIEEVALTPAQKAQETKRKKAEEKAKAAAASAPTQAPSTLGANPFAAGPAAPTHVPQLQQAAPNAMPHIAPIAPIAAPAKVAADPASPRGQYDAACIALVNDLKAAGVDAATFGNIMVGSFTEAGCSPQSKITQIEDAEMQKFYHILKRNVDAAKAGQTAPSYT